MKKIFFLLIILVSICFSSSYAQTSKGNVMLGLSPVISLTGYGSDMASLGFSSIKYKSDEGDSDGDKMTNFGLIPEVGYFVIDDLAVGLDINVSYTSSKSEEGDKSSTSYMAAGPFVRYYFPMTKVSPFIELNSSFGKHVDKYEDEDFKTNITSLGGVVGLAFPLGEKVTFDFAAGYNSLMLKEPEDNEANAKTIIGTIGFRFGVVVFLGAN